jgi:uncharacterized coiled-coil DUF342 family protein
MEKDYFDAQFGSINQRLDKIERNQDELYRRGDEVKERTIKLETRLESGNKKFEYIGDDILELKKNCQAVNHAELKHKVSMMWKIFATVGTALLVSVVGIALKLFTEGK